MHFPIKKLAVSLFLFIITSTPILAQQPQEPPIESYRNGVSLFNKGLYERAAQEFQNFINLHPDNPLTASATFQYVRSMAQVNPAHKEAYYRRFIQMQPNSVYAQKLLFDLALQAKNAGNYDAAIAYYQRVLSHNTTNVQKVRAHYWMAQTAADAGNLAKAQLYYQQVYQLFPESEWAPKALYTKGRLYLEAQQFDQASQTFEVLKKNYPNNEITRKTVTALGETYYKMGRYEQAIESLQQSLFYLDGDEKKKAVLLIAESYNALGQLDDASKTYRRYINLTKGTPGERAAHYGLGWVFYKREIYHWAADEFAKAAVGDDVMARKALYYKAVNEKLGNNYQESLKSFRTFADQYKSGPWFEKGYYEYAVTAYEMGQYGEAIEALLALVRSDAELEWAGKVYTLLGQAYFANNEYTRALQAYKAAEQMTDIPTEVKRQVLFQKAWLLFSGEAYDEAREIFRKLYQEAPDTEIGKKALFWYADANFNLNQFSTAASKFSEFVQKYPQHKLAGAAVYSIGWSYFKMGQYAKAVEPFQRFISDYEPPEISLFPYKVDAKLRLGDSYYAASNYSKAIQAYQTLAGEEQGGDYAMFQIGNSYYRGEQNYRAVTTFRELAQRYPNSSLREQAQYNIAYIYLNSGNYEQAILELKKVIAKFPGTSWAALSQFNIGDAYYNSGQYDKAIAAYKKVLQQYPNSEYVVEAVNAIGYAETAAQTGAKVDKKEESAPDTASAMDTFIQNNPDAANSAKLRYKQAKGLIQTGDYIKAAQALEKLIETSDDKEVLAPAHLDLADAYAKTDRLSKAVATYQSAAQQFPGATESKALTQLGNISARQGNYQAAIDYYNRVVTNGSGNELEAQVGWGNALLALGKGDEAAQRYQAALKIDTNNTPAKIGLARVALNQSNFAQASELLTSVTSSDTDASAAEAQYLLGQVQMNQGNYKQALDAFSKVQVLYEFNDRWVAKSIMGGAKAYIQLGNEVQARKMLEKLISQYPGTAEAQQAQQMLQ